MHVFVYCMMSLQDDSVEEVATPGSWALFIAQVFDQEGAVSGILDVLRDGSPKLQQAYLNIINRIFSESPTPLSKAEEIEVEKILQPVRKAFVKPEGALPSILRLIEQGGSSAVRAKALFAAQLLCRHNPALLSGLTQTYVSLHYTTQHYTTLQYTTLHYTTLHYTTLHYSSLHYTTVHYTTLHYTTLHYT